MTNWFFISPAFCCQFSSTENHSALQQTTLQLIQMSMLALLAFTKTTFYFCPIGPKVGFWLASHCTYYTKADNFTFQFSDPSEFGNIWGGKENRFLAEQMHTRACTYTHMLPLKKFKNESKLFQIMKHRHRRRLLHARNI